MPFYRNAEPQRRAAKHLGHTWKIGKRFANPDVSSSAPSPQELNPWSSSTEEPLHSSTVEKSERQKQKSRSGMPVWTVIQYSVIFCGGDSSKNYGQTNNDCRFRIFISTNSLHQPRLLAGR